MGDTLSVFVVDPITAFVREPDVRDPRHYRRRVRLLACVYIGVFSVSMAGLVTVALNGRFFVTMAQRTNVETLTLAFLLILFAYLSALSARGVVGALRASWFWLRALLASDKIAVERDKVRALGLPARGPMVAMNVVVEKEMHGGERFELRIADEAGTMGSICIDGARWTHCNAYNKGSNEVFPFLAQQIAALLGLDEDALDVVHWGTLDAESMAQYLGQVIALNRIGQMVGKETVWPRVTITDAHCAELERRLSQICGALRDEAFLPHWEYEGEHKIPIIPEPLGIISLSRSERRVDPLPSMTAALIVVSAVLAFAVWFLMEPPWVPGI